MNKEKIIFIVGNSRSGTTMLGRMLGRNKDIFSFPELHLFGPCIPHGKEEEPLSKEKLITVFSWLLDVSQRGFHAKRELTSFNNDAFILADKFYFEGIDSWDAYYHFVCSTTLKNGKKIPCEDLPGNVFKIEQILRKFPNAKIIHIVRDPRDVVLSQKNRHLRRKMGGHYVSKKEALRVWANYHPLVISRLWRNAVSTGLSFKQNEIITIRFEDLLSSPSETLQAICKHANIAFDEQMLNVPQVGSSTQKDDPSKLGVDKSRSGAWQKGGLNDTEIEICENITRHQMIQLNYSLTEKKGGFFNNASYALTLPLKGFLALVLNWNRTKGMLSFMVQRFLK